MKHIQHTEHSTFQKFVKTSKREVFEGLYPKEDKPKKSYSKQRSFKRDMWGVE